MSDLEQPSSNSPDEVPVDAEDIQAASGAREGLKASLSPNKIKLQILPEERGLSEEQLQMLLEIQEATGRSADPTRLNKYFAFTSDGRIQSHFNLNFCRSRKAPRLPEGLIAPGVDFSNADADVELPDGLEVGDLGCINCPGLKKLNPNIRVSDTFSDDSPNRAITNLT